MKEMRRIDRKRTQAFAIKVIEDCNFAVLATVNDDGSPYCIPISPVLSCMNIYFHCALEGQKIDNIKRDNRVCISCVGKALLVPENFTVHYQSAVAYGKASMVEDVREKIYALELICKKYAAENMENVNNAIEKSLLRTGVCKIELESITGKAKGFSEELVQE